MDTASNSNTRTTMDKQRSSQVFHNVKMTGSSQSVVTIKEVVPSNEKIRPCKTQDKKTPRNVRKYYRKQEELLAMLSDSSENIENSTGPENTNAPESNSGAVARTAIISLVFNLVLLIAKAVASYFSGSLSVISSLVDSSIDLISGVVIWLTNRSIRTTDFYNYPVGKTRLEPLAITILSVIMAVASVQLLIESIQQLVKNSILLDIGVVTIVILCTTVLVKFGLFMYCRRYNAPSIQALTEDHRNDAVSNTVALICGYIGDRLWQPADPIGAMLFGIYIAYGWTKIGWNQVKELSGHVAKPECLAKLLQVCCTFDSRILYIDTLTAYHFGSNLIVEAHIVLPPDMTLQEAHDIGEPLQQKLATFSFVERAFVHIDYEYEHQPEIEHAKVNL